MMRVGRTLAAALFVVCALAVETGPVSPALAQAPQKVEHGVEYSAPQGEPLQMDVYIPDGKGPFPAVEMIHPGGFVKGNRNDKKLIQVAQWLVESGYVAFSIDYRLAREDPYPAAVEDAKAAVEFVRQNADRFSVDPDRIGAFGASAGATLAMSVGYEGDGGLTADARVATVVAWSAAFDFPQFVQLDPEEAGRIYLYSGAIKGGRRSVSPAPDAEELLRKASPANYLDPSDPPTFIANGEQELIPLSQAQSAAGALEQAGIPHQLFISEGHALHYRDEARQPTVQFLDRYLKNGPIASSGGQQGSTTEPTRPPEAQGRPTGRTRGWILPVGVALAVVAALLIIAAAARRWRRTAPYRR